MKSGFPTMGMLDGLQEYRRVSDGRLFVVDTPSLLPCDGDTPCEYETLPAEYGEPPVMVYPRRARAQVRAMVPFAGAGELTTAAPADSTSVLLEALAFALVGGGAVAVGYGMAKPQAWVALVGALALVAGLGLKISNANKAV